MEKVEKIHQASMRILEETGMRFHHPEAIKILKDNGIRMEGDIAYFTEEQIMHWVKKAPSIVNLYAADSKYDMQIGGDSRYNGPCGGASFVMEKDGNLRDAQFEDFITLVKLFEGNDAYHLNGGLACQPSDIPTEAAGMLLALASMVHVQKCIFVAAGDANSMEQLIKMACIRFGVTPDELKEKARLCTISNTNTPLYLDKVMTDTILVMAKHRQPVVIASAAMAGTTSPITLAGTTAVFNAEVISTIALTQMIEEGAPVIYGSQSTSADMATGAIAIGSPEGALCYKYCAEMAKFYGVPSRGGGCLTDAKAFDPQAGYESMMTCMACKQSGINLMVQSAGIIDSYLAVSYEKLISDFEIIDYVNRYTKGFEVDDETIPLDLIDEVGHAGQYLVEDHTLEHCRSELFTPNISARGSVPVDQFAENIQARIQKLIDAYQKPELPAEMIEELKSILREQNIDEKYIQMAVEL